MVAGSFGEGRQTQDQSANFNFRFDSSDVVLVCQAQELLDCYFFVTSQVPLGTKGDLRTKRIDM
jgi:hypothetical protein